MIILYLFSSTAGLRITAFDFDRSCHRQTDLSTVLQSVVCWELHSFYSFQYHHHVACFAELSQTPSKQVPYTLRSSASSFNFHFLPFFLKVIQYLRTSSFSSFHALYLSFNKGHQKAVRTKDVANPASLPSFYCMQDILLSAIQNIKLYLFFVQVF